MNKKGATKALAVLLSAASVASVGLPVMTNSLYVSAATVINMSEVEANTSIKCRIAGKEVPFTNLLQNAEMEIEVVPSNTAATKFNYAYKICKPSATGTATTSNGTVKTVSTQKSNKITFKPTDTGIYTLQVQVINRSTGEKFIREFKLTVNASTQVKDGATVYDTNNNRYKVISVANKTVALTGIIEDKSSKKKGFDFEGDTVAIKDKTADGIEVSLEGYTITQFGEGSYAVKRLKKNDDGTISEVTNDPFEEINIPSTVKIIKEKSLTSTLVKTTAKNNGVVYLGTKKTDDLYSSKLEKIESGAIASDMLSKTTFRTYHANVVGGVVNDTNIAPSNAYRTKFGWLKDMPKGATIEAPFGSCVWAFAQLISYFDATNTGKSDAATYPASSGFGCSEIKGFKLKSTSNGSLTTPIHDSKLNKNMIVAVNFYNNNQGTATTTPRYKLVVHNGGNYTNVPSGTVYTIAPELLQDTVLKRVFNKTTGVFKIGCISQSKTGLKSSDIIECNVMKVYNLGKDATDSKITMLPYSEWGMRAMGSPASTGYDSDSKLKDDASTYFGAAMSFPVYKINEGKGYIVFRASNKNYGEAYKKGSKGGEGVVTVTPPTSGTLTSYNGSPYTYNYYVQTAANAADSSSGYDSGYTAINNIKLTRGSWDNSKDSSGKVKGFTASETGDKLKLSFTAKSYRYYLVEYIDLSTDEEEVKVLWDGAAENVQGFDGASNSKLLLDSKLTDNKFYEIRVREYADRNGSNGIRLTAKSTAYPLIDGRGFLKIYNNLKVGTEMTDEVDLNTTARRYVKYYGEANKEYKVDLYYTSDKLKQTQLKESNKSMVKTDSWLTADSFGKRNSALNYYAINYSTTDIGNNFSYHIVIKDSSGNKLTPRVWNSGSALKDNKYVTHTVSGAAWTIDKAYKCFTFCARGVRADISSGKSSFFDYGSGSTATKKSCRAIGPVINSSTGAISGNKMTVKVKVDSFKTVGKTVDRGTIKVQYSTNYKANGLNMASTANTWKDLGCGDKSVVLGNFTSKDSVDYTPKNGLVFYRVAYKYVDVNTWNYSNVVAVTYNALTNISSAQQIQTETMSAIGNKSVASGYKTVTDASDDTIKSTIKERFNGGSILNVPLHGRKADISINNAYSGVPYYAHLNPVIKTSKNLSTFDGIVSAKKYVAVQFSTKVYAIKTNANGTFDNIEEIKPYNVDASGKLIKDKNVTQAMINTGTKNNINFMVDKAALDMKGITKMTFNRTSTADTSNPDAEQIRYIAIVQKVALNNPSDVTASTDTGFNSKTSSKVYVFRLTNPAYTPIAEYENSFKFTAGTAKKRSNDGNISGVTGDNEIKVTVKGCNTTVNDGILGAETIFKSSKNNKYFYTELDTDGGGKLTTLGSNRIKAAIAEFNPSVAMLSFKYTTKSGTVKDASIKVYKEGVPNSGSALKTTHVDKATREGYTLESSINNNITVKMNNASRYIVDDEIMTGVEFVIPETTIKKFLVENDADLSAFDKGIISAEMRVYSSGNSNQLVGYDTITASLPYRSTCAIKGNIKIDISGWSWETT